MYHVTCLRTQVWKWQEETCFPWDWFVVCWAPWWQQHIPSQDPAWHTHATLCQWPSLDQWVPNFGRGMGAPACGRNMVMPTQHWSWQAVSVGSSFLMFLLGCSELCCLQHHTIYASLWTFSVQAMSLTHIPCCPATIQIMHFVENMTCVTYTIESAIDTFLMTIELAMDPSNNEHMYANS